MLLYQVMPTVEISPSGGDQDISEQSEPQIMLHVGRLYSRLLFCSSKRMTSSRPAWFGAAAEDSSQLQLNMG